VTAEPVLDGLSHAEALGLLRAAAARTASPLTCLNLAIAEEHAGCPARGRRLLRELAALLPGWDEPPLRLGQSLRSAGRNAEAALAYDEALARNPIRPESLIARAALHLAAAEPESAHLMLIRCCGVAPERAEAWDLLGLTLQATGDEKLAETAFAEASRRAPRRLDYALHRVEASKRAGTADAELARLALAAAADPLNPVPLAASGVLLHRDGRREQAIEALEAAVALAPDDPALARLHAGLLARSPRVASAEAALARAIALDPADPALRNDHAAVLMRMHRHAEAREILQAVLDAQGPDASILCNLANATVNLGLHAEAEALARRAIALSPAAALPRRTLANVLPYCPGVGAAVLRDALAETAARLPRGPAPIHANSRDPDRKLRLGLLSGTLKTHPVGWLTVAGFETLDPAGFAVTCLSPPAGADPIARRFAALAEAWHDPTGLTDAALAERARGWGLDIVIDLGGYGDAGRMAALAHRLAPVQIKWVGMQTHSSGLPEMGWILTDRWETPPELERFYTERPLRLADGYVCYSPPPYAPDIAPLPAGRTGPVTFGCFNNLAKITADGLAVWADILRRTPGARLVLKCHQLADAPTADRLRAAFAAHGIDPVRIECRGGSGHRTLLGEYNDIDVALDPFPYSGGLTTCEALWMGVPTVTMPGESFASRHSASHLSNAGLADWVVPDRDRYVARAVAAAADLPALAALRAGLRAQVKASPLCDAPRFGRSLGAALRAAWRDWCARR
jgi:predicted O-linked N-acetylglucosamine transferase (SPINDLY family)